MSWILVSIVAVGLIGFAWWWLLWSKKPYRHRNLPMDRFEWLIRSLLETTKDGSVLVIEHEGSDRFIQFVKHDLPSGDAVLGFGFPDAPWSREYFDELRAAFSGCGVDYSISDTDDDRTRRFIEVECNGDPVAIAMGVARIACDVMGIEDSDRFSAQIRGELDSKRAVSEAVHALRSRTSHRE